MRTLPPLERSLLSALRGPCGVGAGQKGLLAVSGGPDSVALLHGLAALRERMSLRLEVVHFDHGLRPEAPQEAGWVRERARAYDLPFHLRRTERLGALAAGVQAAARTWRQEELLRLRTQTGADWIATGHQRDDQLELILLKLLRGAHLSHLHGMAWREGPWVRPLLGEPRPRILAYLRAEGLAWLEDPSNALPKYRRNRVRHELLPLLDTLAGGAIAARLERLERQSRALAAWIAALPPPRQSQPGRWPAWIGVRGLLALPELARGAALYAFVRQHLPGGMEAVHVEPALALLAARTGPRAQAWSLDVPGGRLRRQGARLLVERREGPARLVLRHLDDVRVSAPEAWRIAGGRNPAPGALRLGGVPTGAALTVRQRRPGDRFHPPWRPHAVKVKDFLRDQSVPLWQRERIPVVTLGATVIAIYPQHVAREFAPGAEPRPGDLWLRIDS